MAVLSVVRGSAAMLLLLVPVGRGMVEFPTRLEFGMTCQGSTADLVYVMREPHACETKPYAKVNTTIESCGSVASARDLLMTILKIFVNISVK